VALWQFVIATICLLPKIFLTVFVASRVALLSDGDSRQKMDAGMILYPNEMMSSLFLCLQLSWSLMGYQSPSVFL